MIEEFGKIIVASRNSGVKTCQQMMSGQWHPKNPESMEKDILYLIKSLPIEDLPKLLNLVRYFTDLSFFKLIESIELGEGDVESHKRE